MDVMRLVDVNTLTDSQKQILWRGIKFLEPQLAEMLKTDEVINGLKTEFNATIQFSVQDIHRFMCAGQQEQGSGG